MLSFIYFYSFLAIYNMAVAEPAQPFCNKDLFFVFQLSGYATPSETKNKYCSSIIKNCCPQIDQNRILRYIRDIMPWKYSQYKFRMIKAVEELEDLHAKTMTLQLGQIHKSKRTFCLGAQSKLAGFDIIGLSKEMKLAINSKKHSLQKINKKFFCMLCDGEMSQFFQPVKKVIQIEAQFCQDFVTSYSKHMELMNVKLINYLKLLQDTLDCSYYSLSSNLGFYSKKKIQLAEDLLKCVDNIQTQDFIEKCQTTCSNISLQQINWLVEGDLDFLEKTLVYFNKLLSEKENGKGQSIYLEHLYSRIRGVDDLFDMSLSAFKDNVESPKNSKGYIDRYLIKNKKQERILAANNTNNDKQKTATKQVAKYEYSQQISDLYDAIQIFKSQERQGIFHQPMSIPNLDSFEKVFDVKQGLNPKKVKTDDRVLDPRFDPFEKVKKTADPEILVFLSMFNGDFKQTIEKELVEEYQISLTN